MMRISSPEKVVIGNADLWHGECREVLPLLEPVSAVVTDPPYGIKFMGKRWDYDVPSTELWALVLDRLLPGAHMLAFAGTRTQHRMAVRIEDAGFEIRDMLAWVYGSGFPKSLDVGKAIDKAEGAERRIIAEGAPVKRMIPGADQHATGSWIKDNGRVFVPTTTEPATDAARQWDGWGTALKPSFEPITLARKPLVGTVAQSVQAHGTGGLNIDGCRVDGGDVNPSIARRESAANSGKCGSDMHSALNKRMGIAPFNKDVAGYVAARAGEVAGRWPANLIHDGSDEVVALFPQTASGALNQASVSAPNRIYGLRDGYRDPKQYAADAGSAARFFYCAKAAAAERGEGNDHPTVKPLALMRWLLTLVVPPGGLVLDPFLGSGSTGVAAIEMGMRFIGIERDRKSFDIACARIEAAQRQGRLLLPPGASDQPPAPSPIQALL